jgi:hypothetical protein
MQNIVVLTVFRFLFQESTDDFSCVSELALPLCCLVYNPSGADTSPDTGLPLFLTSPRVILLSYFPPIKKKKRLSSLP